jgi:hypothetical protein
MFPTIAAVKSPVILRLISLLAASFLVGCTSVNPTSGITPTPARSTAASPSTAAPSASSTTPEVPASFPLAVATGITNLKSTISLDELDRLAARNRLLVPCGIEVAQPALSAPANCRAADRVAGFLQGHQQRVALLPPGLVEPATKVLSIAGDGPFGMFGADLFGDRKARGLDYPLIGSAAADAANTLDPAWLAYDQSQVWTLTNIGSLCSSPLVADQAVGNGLGWGWVFNGGTARYTGPEAVDPPDDGPYDQYRVTSVETGDDGATPAVLKRSDLAIADHECPVVPDEGWGAQTGPQLVFTVPEAVVVQWQRKLGLDAVYLAANHMSDAGVGGIESTLRILDKHELPHTGLGMNLREAIRPTFLEAGGLKVALVAFNDVNGVARADAFTPGVPWITRQNVNRAVRLARDGGADLVICSPQWWGGAEYHDDLWPIQAQQLGWFDDAGCDQVIGSGTHVAGPVLLRQGDGGPSVVVACPGNYMFGQNWWQEVDEGVIVDLSFSGTRLVNVRLRPYVMHLHARPSLLDPEGDGRYVMQRIFKYSTVDYRP